MTLTGLILLAGLGSVALAVDVVLLAGWLAGEIETERAWRKIEAGPRPTKSCARIQGDRPFFGAQQ